MADSDQEHLVNHLRDTHAIEIQALRQLERAAQAAGENDSVYEDHLEQTKGREEKLRELVEARGHEPSPIEDKTLRGGAIGLRQLADVPLDTPVKTAMNLYALEHLEIATFGLLAELARALDDDELAQAAEQIMEEDQAAAEALEDMFDSAVEGLLERAREDEKEAKERREDGDQEDGDSQDGESRLLLAHLDDVHALERQSLALLQAGLEEIDQDDELERIYKEHLEQTEEHEKLINERIEERDAKPSAVRDLHMGAATAGLRDITSGPPDAQAKLAMNVFCVEHLEIAAYELLARLAKHCGDDQTVKAAEKILEEERKAAETLREQFEHLARLTLESDASYATARAAETDE